MTDSKSIPYSSARTNLIVAVGVVERLTRITNFVLVDLAEFGFGIDFEFDRIIRLTVVGVDRINFLLVAVAAAVAVAADRTNWFAVLEVVLYSHQTCCR